MSHLSFEPKSNNNTYGKTTIILFHGSESSNEDLRPIAPFFEDVRLLLPQAPLNSGENSFNWFHYNFVDNNLSADNISLEKSLEIAKTFIEDIKKKHPDDRIYIGGLSLGAIFGNELFLKCPHYFDGMICMSGFLLDHENYPSLHNKKTFVAHGKDDQIISMEKANNTVKKFIEKEAQVEFKKYDMGHGICEQELTDVVKWIGKNHFS